MKKRDYDLLQKAVDFVNTKSVAVQSIISVATDMLIDVSNNIDDFVGEFNAKVTQAMDESPLEDPVVPTGQPDNSAWASATDNTWVHLDGASVEDKRRWLRNQVGYESYKNLFENLSDESFLSIYETAKKVSLSLQDIFKKGL